MKQRDSLGHDGAPAVRENTDVVGFSDLAEGRISRARAIKLAGAMVGTGAFALFMGGTAEARPNSGRRRRRRRRIRRRRQNNVTTEQSTVNFGAVDLGETLPVRNVAVFNNGDTPVRVRPTVVGRGFTLVDTDPITIRPGESELVGLTVTDLLTDGAAGQLKLVDVRDGLLLETVDLAADVL